MRGTCSPFRVSAPQKEPQRKAQRDDGYRVGLREDGSVYKMPRFASAAVQPQTTTTTWGGNMDPAQTWLVNTVPSTMTVTSYNGEMLSNLMAAHTTTASKTGSR